MRYPFLLGLVGVALASLAVAPQPARAMHFFTVNTNDGRLLLVAEGEIKEAMTSGYTTSSPPFPPRPSCSP